MRRIPALLGIGLLLMSIAIGAIACSDDDNGGSVSDTPTAISQETPSSTEPSATEATSTDTTPATEGAAVSVNLKEYTVSPDPAAVPAGPVTFTAKNTGGTEHELVVIKTDLAAESLPTNADGSVNEEGGGVEAIDEIAEFPGAEERELTLDLAAGAYVLICNVVEESTDGTTTSHYAEGMTTAFTVQ